MSLIFLLCMLLALWNRWPDVCRLWLPSSDSRLDLAILAERENGDGLEGTQSETRWKCAPAKGCQSPSISPSLSHVDFAV